MQVVRQMTDWREIAKEFQIQWNEMVELSEATILANVRRMAEEIAMLRSANDDLGLAILRQGRMLDAERAYSAKLREALDKSCACEFIQECKSGKWGDVKLTVSNICPACEALSLKKPGEE